MERAVNRAAVRYDRDGDQHYDVTSAFIKSIRGSDVDAAVHYLARMIEAGEDPRFIARRLMIHASRGHRDGRPDGAADRRRRRPGGPAGRAAGGADRPGPGHHPLATAPKSNAVIIAIDAAMADVREGKAGSVPPHAAGRALPGRGETRQRARAMSTRTTARAPWSRQQYPPDELVGRDYYQPTDYGAERALAERVAEAAASTIRGEYPDEQRQADQGTINE